MRKKKRKSSRKMEGKVGGKGRRKKWHSKLIISFKNVYSGEMTGKPFFQC